MESNTKNAEQQFKGEDTLTYNEKRKAMDPEPWIKPTTMERFSEKPLDGFSVFHPRVVWPEHGGRMVRRDYLRPGDRAVSSHYGKATVELVQLAGVEGQTTMIVWVSNDPSFVRHEAYDSSSLIELLPEDD